MQSFCFGEDLKAAGLETTPMIDLLAGRGWYGCQG